VISEVEVFQHVYDIVRRIGLDVLFPKVIQNLNFDESLVMESLLVPVKTRERETAEGSSEFCSTYLIILMAMC
jgi:hypothetical protein